MLKLCNNNALYILPCVSWNWCRKSVVKEKLNSHTIKNNIKSLDNIHTATGSWCFSGLSVEVKHKSSVSSNADMYCFDISLQRLCCGYAIIWEGILSWFKWITVRKSKFQTYCHPTINTIENSFPKGYKIQSTNRGKWGTTWMQK